MLVKNRETRAGPGFCDIECKPQVLHFPYPVCNRCHNAETLNRGRFNRTRDCFSFHSGLGFVLRYDWLALVLASSEKASSTAILYLAISDDSPHDFHYCLFLCASKIRPPLSLFAFSPFLAIPLELRARDRRLLPLVPV